MSSGAVCQQLRSTDQLSTRDELVCQTYRQGYAEKGILNYVVAEKTVYEDAVSSLRSAYVLEAQSSASV